MTSTVPAIRFRDVTFSYPGCGEVLSHVSFSVMPGERVALVGLNGCGKSTLMLLADGLLMPDSGSVEIGGTLLTDKTAAACRRAVGMVFQNADDQLFMPTVADDVAFGPRNMGLDEAEVARRVDRALELTGCAALRDTAPFRLSGGRKKMVSIATVLSMQPDLLMFDEPTTGLDYASSAMFAGIVTRLAHTMLMSTHDMELARALCGRALVMDRGTVIYDGPVGDMPYPPASPAC